MNTKSLFEKWVVRATRPPRSATRRPERRWHNETNKSRLICKLLSRHSVRRAAGRNRPVACATQNRILKQALSRNDSVRRSSSPRPSSPRRGRIVFSPKVNSRGGFMERPHKTKNSGRGSLSSGVRADNLLTAWFQLRANGWIGGWIYLSELPSIQHSLTSVLAPVLIATFALDSFRKKVCCAHEPTDERISVHLSALRSTLSLRPPAGGTRFALSSLRQATHTYSTIRSSTCQPAATRAAAKK